MTLATLPADSPSGIFFTARGREKGAATDVWGLFDRAEDLARTVIAREAEVTELRTRLADATLRLTIGIHFGSINQPDASLQRVPNRGHFRTRSTRMLAHLPGAQPDRRAFEE